MLIPEEAEVIRHLLGTSEHQLEVASTLLSGWPAVKKGGCLHWQAEIAALLGLIWTESSRRKTCQAAPSGGENKTTCIFSTSWKSLKPAATRWRQRRAAASGSCFCWPQSQTSTLIVAQPSWKLVWPIQDRRKCWIVPSETRLALQVPGGGAWLLAVRNM